MKSRESEAVETQKQFRFLLADDDQDDRIFFQKAIDKIFPYTEISFVEDGEKLMKYLDSRKNILPDILFLDLNMPRKNGAECLKEIRENPNYDGIAIIIYSTTSPENIIRKVNVADDLYNNGAHYFLRKPSVIELGRILQDILNKLRDDNLSRPHRDLFVLHLA